MRYSEQYGRHYNDQYYWKDRRDRDYKPSIRHKWWIKKNKNPLVYLTRRIELVKRLDYQIQHSGICPSGWTKGQGWGGLYKAWQGFIIQKLHNDFDGMEYYATAIRKIEKDIGVAVREFPELKIAALEYMHEPENDDLLREKAEELHKDVDDLSSQDILDIMLEQDRKPYDEVGMQY